VERIGKFYEIERQIADACADDRLKARGDQSRPLVEALFAWLTSIQLGVLPKARWQSHRLCAEQPRAAECLFV